MELAEINVVTGAFSYTGKYITRRLLALGKKVRTLTGHPNRLNPFGGQVEVLPLAFDRPAELAKSLENATTLYNTYWIRFPHGQLTFSRAVANTRELVQAAENAGVRKIVHISITNASEDSPFPYFRGKAEVEKLIVGSRLSYTILRPTVIFGPEDILINNIAWLLRRSPVFAIPDKGDYRLQPVFVEDVGELATRAGQDGNSGCTDAVGPEIYSFDQLVRLLATAVHSKAKIVHVKPGLAHALSRMVSWVVRDVLLTRDEIDGLMANLLVSKEPPTGQTRLSEWLSQNASTIGMAYASELARHYRRG